MRLLLDAHLSGPRIATELRRRGHDVVAVHEYTKLNGTSDDELLALAMDQDRLFVTCDVKDFPRLMRQWAEAGRSHAGCVILVGLDHNEFGAIIAALDTTLTARPEQSDWHDHTRYIPRLR